MRGLTRRSERYNWVPGEEKILGLAGVLRRVSGVKPAQQRPFRAAIVLRGFRLAASRVAGFPAPLGVACFGVLSGRPDSSVKDASPARKTPSARRKRRAAPVARWWPGQEVLRLPRPVVIFTDLPSRCRSCICLVRSVLDRCLTGGQTL